MRNLFFMLVVANVLFFGWQYWVREPEPPGVTVVDPRRIGDTVALIRDDAPDTSDVEAADDTDDAAPVPANDAPPLAREAAAKPVTASIGRTCVSVGPFTEVSEAQAELKALKTVNADVAQRATQGNLFARRRARCSISCRMAASRRPT